MEDRRVDAFEKHVNDFVLKMKRLQIKSSLAVAKRTLELMRELLVCHKFEDHQGFIDQIKEVGTEMICARPHELVVGNMIRRVLFIIRDIAGEQAAGHPVTIASKTMADEPLERPVSALTFVAPERPRGQLASFYANLLEAPREGGVPAPAPALQPPPGEPLAAPGLDAEAGLGAGGGGEPQGSEGGGIESALSLEGLKPKRKGRQWSGHRVVIDLVNELIDEMDLAEDAIAAKATTHIHANEVILTFGLSQTTLKFLLKAAERRSFQVIVAEGAPKLAGLTMARHLTDAGIPTLVIPDACTFALMARVNKVLVGAQAVLATGGVIAQAGSKLVAQAAKHHAVPFVVVTGLYKLSPLFPHDPHVMFTKFESPAQSAPRSLQSATLRAGEDGLCREGRLFLPCPAVDYIDPECIDLLITDTGGYTPSYIYRLLAEYYSREDYALSKELLERLVRR